MMETIFEFTIILVLVVFQSLFGVGLLLFGTPTFLFMGYGFESTLTLLLPLSIFISFLQIIYQKNSIKSLVLEYNIFCLPFLILFLVIAINFGEIVDIKIYVSAILIIFPEILFFADSLVFISSASLCNSNAFLYLDFFS